MDIVRYLGSQRGCSTACQNENGDIPLHKASREGHVDMVRYLVCEEGCRTACQNKLSNTPLLEACRYGHVDILLVKGGAVQPVKTRIVILHCMLLVVRVMWIL